MIAAGIVKPDMKLVITYGSDDGEDFIESVMYPFGYNNSNENRKSRVPRFLFEKLAEVFYNTTNAPKLLDLYPCPKAQVQNMFNFFLSNVLNIVIRVGQLHRQEMNVANKQLIG